MFKDLEAAHAAFADFTSQATWDVISTLLMPVLVLAPVENTGATSLTFVGGTPVMSAALDWPVPPAVEDIDAFANRGGEAHAKSIRDALDRRLPYSFIGQINLAEMSDVELPDTELPNTGRLLFSMMSPPAHGTTVPARQR